MVRYSFCAALVLATSISTAAPVVIFNSFGPGDSYELVGWTVGCGAACWHDEGHTSAWSFTPGQTVRLSSVETVAQGFVNTASTLVVTIANDDFGLPGAGLESFSSSLFTVQLILDFASIDRPILQAGQRYWFIAATQDLVNQAANMAISPVELSGTSAYRVGGGPWIGPFEDGMRPSAYPVFRVTGQVVPEPATVLLVGCGLLAVWAKRRR